jgi:hypothetical protein
VLHLEQPRARVERHEEGEVLSQPCRHAGCALKGGNLAAIHGAHASGQVGGVIDPLVGHLDDDSESVSVVVVDVILDAVDAHHEVTALNSHLIAHADTSAKSP